MALEGEERFECQSSTTVLSLTNMPHFFASLGLTPEQVEAFSACTEMPKKMAFTIVGSDRTTHLVIDYALLEGGPSDRVCISFTREVKFVHQKINHV